MNSLKESIATHDNNFNLVRLILASSVIYYHSFLLTASAKYKSALDSVFVSHGASLGEWAVGVFFFLSGIFVSQSFHRDGSPLNFFIRRFCRLWPGYFICLCVSAVIACLLSQGQKAHLFIFHPSFFHYIISNSLFNLTWEIPGIFQGRLSSCINGSIHTLPTEVKMYALLILSGFLLPMRKIMSIAFAAAFFLFASVFFFERFAGCLDLRPQDQFMVVLFFLGVVCFVFAQYVRPYLWLGALSLALTLILKAPWNTVAFFTTAVWVAVFIGQMKLHWNLRTDISYGIYIYGWPCEQFVATFYPDLGPLAHAASALVLSACFAFLSWHLVEKPAIRLGHNFIAALAYNVFSSRKKLSVPVNLVLLGNWLRFAVFIALFFMCVVFYKFTVSNDLASIHISNTRISSFGPTGTKAGTHFNLQPLGESALWLQMTAPLYKNSVIVFDDTRLHTIVNGNVATAYVPKALYDSPGDKKVFVEIRCPGEVNRTEPVFFHITE